MARSVWKPPFCEINIKNTVHKIKVWSRRSVILPSCINKRFLVYNGKNFIAVNVSMEMIGHKFGEFATTRKKPYHKSKKNMYKSKLPKKR